MNMQDLRLECLRLAAHRVPEVDRARGLAEEWVNFVLGKKPPTSAKTSR